MSRKYNKQQSQYITAKSLYNLMENAIHEEEEKFLILKGFTNPDGSIPNRIYAIDNEELFDLYNEEFSSLIEESGLWDKYLKSQKNFKFAENELVAYALSISPAGIRTTPSEGARNNLKIRDQLIETVLKLDTRTVK